MKTWAGTAKAKARDISLPTKKKKSVLLLPGSECRCVKNLFDHNLLDQKSMVTLIERDPKIFDVIAEQLETKQLPIASYDLHECELYDFQPERKYDYVFIDLLGTPCSNLVKWFVDIMKPQLTTGADVMFNFNTQRCGSFIQNVMNHCYDNYFMEIYDLENLIDENNVWIKSFYALIAFMMEGFLYQVEEPYIYRDSTTMVTIVCRDLQVINQEQPFCFRSLL